MKDFLIEIFAHPWNIFRYKTKTAQACASKGGPDESA